MQLVVSLVVVVAVVTAWTQVSSRPGRRTRVHRSARRRPLLPEGHRPPPGLGPLSPSERFLRQEAARGLRELQLFLLDQRTA